MRHTTISGHHRAHDVEAAVFWIFAGIIVVIAFSEVLALLAIGFAIVTAAWWISRHLERRAATSDFEAAPVTRLLPAASGHHDVGETSHASWIGPSAA
jgi:predicted PurR-regulated permease PerM